MSAGKIIAGLESAVRHAQGDPDPGTVEHRPTGLGIRSATYVSVRARLRGKTCLIQDVEGIPGGCKVQFDDLRLKEAFGWWRFRKSDFEERRP